MIYQIKSSIKCTCYWIFIIYRCTIKICSIFYIHQSTTTFTAVTATIPSTHTTSTTEGTTTSSTTLLTYSLTTRSTITTTVVTTITTFSMILCFPIITTIDSTITSHCSTTRSITILRLSYMTTISTSSTSTKCSLTITSYC